MDHSEVVLTARDLARSVGQHTLWRGISFEVRRGDILFVRGPSGVGKTLLLRTLACLDPVEAGYVRLLGRSPSEVGMPCWRAQVMYVHQQRVTYPGTPLQMFERVKGFASHKTRTGRVPGSAADLGQVAEQLGLDQAVLSQQWSELSGGQAQRVSLALSIALRPQVLLLDEPTSACDTQAALRVEAALRQFASCAAVLWVTHEESQPERVGGRVLVLPSGDVTTLGTTQLPQSLDGGLPSIQATDGSSSQLQQQQQHGQGTSRQQHEARAGSRQPPAPPAWRPEAAAVKA